MGESLTDHYHHRCSNHRQQGVALIIMLTLLVLAGLGLVITGLNLSDGQAEREQITTAALAEAKQALLDHGIFLGYESSTDPGYYSLPCPDRSVDAIAEGGADGSCTVGLGKTAVGRLPWRTLGLPPIIDGSGECLWYVLSGNQNTSKLASNGSLFNPDSKGQLEIRNLSDTILAGNAPEERTIAAIIAPGSALAGQNRTALPNGVDHCGGNYTADNYLDNTNGIDNASPSTITDAVTQLITTHQATESLNDRIIWITRQELADVFTQKVNYQDKNGRTFNDKIDNLLLEIGICLANYDTGGLSRLPWAAPLALADYRVDANYDDAPNQLFGRLPMRIDDSNTDSGNGAAASYVEDCLAANPNTEIENYRKHWKDHLFYAVAGDHAPDQVALPNCNTGNCLSVDGSGDYAAIILFAGLPVSTLNQIRNDAFPVGDVDTKQQLASYLEGSNLANFPDNNGDKDYANTALPGINDRLFCIDSADLLNGIQPDGACD